MLHFLVNTIAKDMRTTILILTFLFIGFWASAQSVSRKIMANAGVPLASTDVSINFSLGEPIVGLVSNENSALDQGFWAGYLFIALTENTSDDLVLFPIPVTDVLHIIPGDNQVFALQVFSMTGQQVMSRVFGESGPEIQVDMSTLANATYLANVFVRGESKSRTFKIIKQ